jgi:photosystem II stability/assembly factor-like uncharacterized protein
VGDLPEMIPWRKHFTIMTIAESPLNDQVIWVGTDDGNVQMTKDGGGSWTNVKLNIQAFQKKYG